MHQLSAIQLLALWHQLERSYYRDASFGRDTCEIYQYTLMRACPSVDAVKQRRDVAPVIGSIVGETAKEVFQEANDALYSVIEHFIAMHEIDEHTPGVKVTIEERAFGTWVRELGQWHRMHICVESLSV